MTHLLGAVSARSDGGRSVVTLNLGVAFAQLGRRTVLTDLGTSGFRHLLGLSGDAKGVREFISHECRSLNLLVHPSPVPNLSILGPGPCTNGAGASAGGPAPLVCPQDQRARLMRALGELEADFVLADFGTHLDDHAADFFSTMNGGILAVSADPDEIVRSYEFLKRVVTKTIRRRLGPDSETAAVLALNERGGNGTHAPNMESIIELVRSRDRDEAGIIEEICESFAPLLIMEAGQTVRDTELGEKLRIICRRFLSIRLERLGLIYGDAAGDSARGNKGPVVAVYAPNSRTGVAMRRIAHKCFQSKTFRNARQYAARIEAGVPQPQPGALNAAAKSLLDRIVRREISEVEWHLSRAEHELQRPLHLPTRQPVSGTRPQRGNER